MEVVLAATSLPITPFLAGAFTATVVLGVGYVISRALAKRPILPIRFAQAALFLIGTVGAAARAFPLHHKADEDYPVIDLPTLAFLAAIPIAFVLPRLRSLEGFGVKLGTGALDDVDSTIDRLETTIQDAVELIQAWTSTYGIFVERLDQAPDIGAAKALVDYFLRDRLDEARQWIGGQESSQPRISLWLHEAGTDRLVFYFSNDISDPETTSAYFVRGEGFAGQAFEENRTLNAPDATKLPRFKQIRSRAPRYRAVLATPIAKGSEVAGVLTVDKLDATRFSDESEAIANAVATLAALALDAYVERCAAVTAQEGGA